MCSIPPAVGYSPLISLSFQQVKKKKKEKKERKEREREKLMTDWRHR